MYEKREIEISKRYLQEVITALRDPVVILGGWATFFLVKDRYRETTGRTYIGSRDIDIGFHIEDKADLTDSHFAHSYYILTERLGFRPLAFRLFKEIHIDTGEGLSSDKAKNLPSHLIFPIYVDMVVDFISSGFREHFGFTPVDEPLLTSVFNNEDDRVEVKEFDSKLWLPSPELLLSMKIKSCPNRDKGHKRVKDICDISSLLLFSTTELNRVSERLRNALNSEMIMKFNASISTPDLRSAADILGLDFSTVENIIQRIR